MSLKNFDLYNLYNCKHHMIKISFLNKHAEEMIINT